MSDQLKVTLVQSQLHWEDHHANRDMFSEQLGKVSETDLIVLPEMFTTGFTMDPSDLAEEMDGATVQWLKKQAVKKNAVICGSLIVVENGHFFNRFIAAYPDGQLQSYDKKHLFTLAGEDANYHPGKERKILTIKDWKLLPMICYDLRFPIWARSVSSKENPWEYDGLLFVANWPKPRVNAWDVLLKARAIENQAYCIGVNRIGTDGNGHQYVGHSAVYDYAGEPILQLHESSIVQTVTLSKTSMNNFREKLPFQRDADAFEIS